ncbi:hypothetical protein HK099_002836 [Clydaea vesicula]|uniref:Transmembrane protein 14 n=1 Tax=Clydaea vesicula TaxID=447962 RepID=A0AAD5U239_9FUNG|nr:hypothetical protein HK099_002836 [Clydaea vesicula]
MSHHIAYTMAGLISAGGLIGFAKKGSKASLIAGCAVGGLYATSGYLISENRDNGIELALSASVLLSSAFLPKAIRTQKVMPVFIATLGVLTTCYYGKKLYENIYGISNETADATALKEFEVDNIEDEIFKSLPRRNLKGGSHVNRASIYTLGEFNTSAYPDNYDYYDSSSSHTSKSNELKKINENPYIKSEHSDISSSEEDADGEEVEKYTFIESWKHNAKEKKNSRPQPEKNSTNMNRTFTINDGYTRNDNKINDQKSFKRSQSLNHINQHLMEPVSKESFKDSTVFGDNKSNVKTYATDSKFSVNSDIIRNRNANEFNDGVRYKRYDLTHNKTPILSKESAPNYSSHSLKNLDALIETLNMTADGSDFQENSSINYESAVPEIKYQEYSSKDVSKMFEAIVSELGQVWEIRLKTIEENY